MCALAKHGASIQADLKTLESYPMSIDLVYTLYALGVSHLKTHSLVEFKDNIVFIIIIIEQIYSNLKIIGIVII